MGPWDPINLSGTYWGPNHLSLNSSDLRKKQLFTCGEGVMHRDMENKMPQLTLVVSHPWSPAAVARVMSSYD